MKTVRITESFSGYPKAFPKGEATRADEVRYEAGTEVEMTDAYAELIVGKGLGTLASAKAAGSSEGAKAEPTKPAPAITEKQEPSA
ncbi:hypothetical protein HNR00_003587 [Methylorubrum rhodinum]|uniref:Uncharacterized protein n=1 Tax=Methylorubrum rhodinum TaxID=29428 RepID=A0A840ZNG0_9HYPH|nr:hypothetical protein [Methylorubrum rhodinum]MBB5758860.1 hypothetical protein [Methylorubrum rhodinum]